MSEAKRGLLDLDLVVYKVGSICDNNHYLYKGEKWETKAELNEKLKADGVTKESEATVVTKGKDPETWDKCKDILIKYLEGILDNFQDYRCFLSGKGNFRYKVATIQPYKGHRDSSSRPYHYDNIRQFLVEAYSSELSIGMEADDAIGLASGDEKDVIVTIDKDLNCIPGLHYNWDTDKYTDVDELDSYRHFFGQMLTGDSTDNILGLYGIGIASTYVKALKKMDTTEEMATHVALHYKKHFGSYANQFMVETAKLLWILQPRGNPIVSGRYW